MKINDLRQRLHKDRAMAMISLRIPEDVVEDLKRIAPLLGFSGYQPLIRAYIGQGLRADLERLEAQSEIAAMVENLRKYGVSDEIITASLAESRPSWQASATESE